jgi:hypothetical protein
MEASKMAERDEPVLRYDEEIRLVDAIIKKTDPAVRPNGILLSLWGATLAVVDTVFFAHYHAGVPGIQAADAIANALAIGLLAVTVIALLSASNALTHTLVDRQIGIAFSVAAIVLFTVLNLHFPQWLLPGATYGLLENMAFCLPMLSLGVQHRERVLLIGGIVLLVSLFAMRLDAPNVDLYAASGIAVGLLAPGLYYVAHQRKTKRG